MTTYSQFATVAPSPEPSERPAIPKRDTPKPPLEPSQGIVAGRPIHLAWPILVIGLSAVLTLTWTVFLAWKAAGAIAMVMM